MMERIRNMRLQHKLTASYLIACLVPLFIVSLTIYQLAIRNLEDTSYEFTSIYNSQMITTIDDFVQEIDNITKSVLVDNDILNHLNNGKQTSMKELIDNQLTMQKLLMRINTLKSDVESVAFISHRGSSYQYFGTNDMVNEGKLMEQPWLQQLLQSRDKLTITPIHDRSYYDHPTGGAVFTAGRVVLTPDGKYAGVLLIDLDPASLIRLNDKFTIARDNYHIKLTVTTHDGGIVYDSDIAGGKGSWEELIGQIYVEPEQEGTKSSSILLSNRTQSGGLSVHTEIPRKKLFANMDRMKVVTVLAISLCIVAVLFISFLFSYSITKPVKRLRKSMMLAEDGVYMSIAPSPSNDEINGLVRSYNKMILKIKTLIEEVYLAEIKQRHAKFLALQTQINPHMLYNTLESIRMKAMVSGDDQVAVMIKLLSRMFKLALGKNDETHLIRHELEYAVNYMELQNIRYDNRFTLNVRLSEEMKDVRITSLVFQPIIENSITHGFDGYDKELLIMVDGEWSGNDLLIRISNNGGGISAERADEVNRQLQETEFDRHRLVNGDMEERSGNNIGLKNIAERIRLQYGNGYDLRIAPGHEGGTVVEIRIPKR